MKVGTRIAKRTTVPLLYNLEDSVDGLDVIDFPGVDDSDHTVPELADLLLSIAQIIYSLYCGLQVSCKCMLNLLTTFSTITYIQCKVDNFIQLNSKSIMTYIYSYFL